MFWRHERFARRRHLRERSDEAIGRLIGVRNDAEAGFGMTAIFQEAAKTK
jgi:hypothetical protein